MLKSAFKGNMKLIAVFLLSLVATVFIFTACSTAFAATQEDVVISDQISDGKDVEAAPDDTSLLYDIIGVDGSQPLEVILLITLLSLAPSILIMLTSFTRIIIVFSFLRSAMQTQTTPPNQVLTGLALFLTVFIMWPVFSEINTIAYQPYANGELTTWEAVEAAGKPLKTFMLKQTTNSNVKFFLDMSQRAIYTEETLESEAPVAVNVDEITLTDYEDQLGFEIVIPAFIVSELTRAFQMGFMLFVPFLIIDLVVSSVLMSMGMMMLPPAMISLPFKILMFVLVDGWQMIVGSLVSSFN